MFSCEFDRRGCQHDALFLSEYKRTNRTKGTKILRCFPHCCPGHVNRSYCGSAVHVRVQSLSKRSRFTPDGDLHDEVRLDQLFVFAHFEEVGAHTYAVGDELPRDDVFQSIQSEQHPKGEWIQGDATDALDRGTQLFQINPGARWYYEWESAATKAQRFTKHVLKAYVFRASSSDRLRIVAAATSSQFKVVSYRRAPSEISGDRRILALLAENVARQSGELGLEPDNLIASLSQRMLPLLVESQQAAKEDKTGIASPTSSWSPQQQAPVAPHRGRLRRPQDPIRGQLLEKPVESKRVWAASHQRELAMSKRLAVVAIFLSTVPAVDFQPILAACGAMMGSPRHREAKSEEIDTPFGGRISWQFLASLRHSSPEKRSLPSLRDARIAASTKDNEVSGLVSQCVEAATWVLADESSRSVLTQLLREGSRALLNQRALRDVFLRVITQLHERIDRFLTSRFGSTLTQLHEDLVAALFRGDAFKLVRPQLLRQLSSTSMAGFETFVCLIRQGFAAGSHCHHKRRRGDDYPRSRGQYASAFDGNWCFDGLQCSLTRLTGSGSPALSVAGAIEWMREFANVAIAVDPRASAVTVRSQWKVAERGMVLVLDGKRRVFDAFPSGVASTVPWNALAWGDYRAQLVGANCLMLELSAWPVPTTEDDDETQTTRPDRAGVALRVKLCLRVTASQESPVLAVDGVLEHGACGPHVTTLPIDARRQAVDTWTPVYQVKALYASSALNI